MSAFLAGSFFAAPICEGSEGKLNDPQNDYAPMFVTSRRDTNIGVADV
jgi:hypothetical protein